MLAKTYHAVIRGSPQRGYARRPYAAPWVHPPTPIRGRWTTSRPH